MMLGETSHTARDSADKALDLLTNPRIAACYVKSAGKGFERHLIADALEQIDPSVWLLAIENARRNRP